MARIGNRQHGALGEVERQNALFKERKEHLTPIVRRVGMAQRKISGDKLFLLLLHHGTV